MASSEVRESVSDIEAEILVKVRRQAEVRSETKDEAEQVRDYAKFRESPVDSGEYASKWHVEDRPDFEGMPAFAVVNDDFKAHWIEYGTEADPAGSKSRFGPNTPTPAFNVAAKTAAHFGGTP